MAQVNLNTPVTPKEQSEYKGKAVVQGKMGEKKKTQQIADGVKSGVKSAIKDAIMPTIQRSIYDLATDALKATLEAIFGIKMDRARKTTYGGSSITRYGDIYEKRVSGVSKPVNSSVEDYKYIEFQTKADVESLLEALDAVIEEYDRVSVADLKDLAGLVAEPIDRKWGWKSLAGARPAMSNGCWRLSMPQIVRI